MFRRLLVANRGEIAVRIIAACRVLGIEVVVVVSDADRQSKAASLADRSVCIGPASARDSYLRADILVTAAQATGCDAIHPGYGFLAERPDFERLCRANGITFIGPSAEAMELMGDKITSRRFAKELGLQFAPGSIQAESPDQAIQTAHKVGYPILIKASAGGGGRGIRLVNTPEELVRAFETASREAKDAFGDPTVFLERYVVGARHVEVQIMGDSHGHVVHLGERDCSVQRRYQKLIEETPSPGLVGKADVRRRMTSAAVTLADAVGYLGAGTVEFLFDPETDEFYFLEMNTRIQVEHPITEMVTGRDLVVEQILVASGERLSFGQDNVIFDGHAIEFRINAEDPNNSFMPHPGRITTWEPPKGDGIRLDTHCYAGYLVPHNYDSLLGKLIVHGKNRLESITIAENALSQFSVEGIPTLIPFYQAALKDSEFRSGQTNTQWAEAFYKRWQASLALQTS